MQLSDVKEGQRQQVGQILDLDKMDAIQVGHVSCMSEQCMTGPQVLHAFLMKGPLCFI